MNEVIYQLPTWAETVLIVCVAIMLAGLAAFITVKTIQEAIEAEAKLERRRYKKETKALNNWQNLYEEEKQKRLRDVADLINENSRLLCENKRMRELLGKVKVKDL